MRSSIIFFQNGSRLKYQPMKNIPALEESILKKSVDECSVEELEKIVDQHPYFAPAQFLLVEKLKRTNSDQYFTQLQKLALYFNNPLWLEHLINEEANYSEEIAMTEQQSQPMQEITTQEMQEEK